MIKKLLGEDTPVRKIDVTPLYSKVTSAIWGPLEETIISGHDNGDLLSWDLGVLDEIN